MYKVKLNAPELGDNLEAGTLFPVCLDMVDKKYAAFLENEHPELYKLMMEIREWTLEVTGLNRLQDLAERSDNKAFIEKTRQRILDAMDVLGEDLPLDARQEKVERHGKMADELVGEVICKFFPGYENVLGMRNEVMTTNNLGKLLAMAGDPQWNEKVRYEAKRKFRLIKLFAEIDYALKERKDHLEFFFDLMGERVFVPNGRKKGSTKTKWLLSTHDLKDRNQCKECELLDKPPVSLVENQLVESIDFRTFEVDLPDGNKLNIDFMMHPSEKTSKSLLLKWLRHPERSFDSLFRDVNRVRLILKNERDIELFKATLIERLQTPDPETGKSYKVREEKPKNGVGGKDPNNPAIPCDKFNLVIDGDKDIEFQVFILEQHADYHSLQGDSWCEYEVSRFFDNNLFQTFFPKAYYLHLDQETIKKEAMKQAYQLYWESKRILPIMPPKEGQADQKPTQDETSHNVSNTKSLAA